MEGGGKDGGGMEENPAAPQLFSTSPSLCSARLPHVTSQTRLGQDQESSLQGLLPPRPHPLPPTHPPSPLCLPRCPKVYGWPPPNCLAAER